MHTFIGKCGTRIFHNGDYSGVSIILDDDGKEFRVETSDLIEFVMEHVRDNMIEKLEQATTEDLMKKFIL